MAVMYKITFAAGTAPARDPKRSIMSVVNAPAAAANPTTNEIILYVGDSIAKRRRSEIIATWKWLFAGVKENNRIDKGSFQTSALVTCVKLDKRTYTDRRTNTTLAGAVFAEGTDVALAWGASVAPGGMTQDLRSAVYKLIRFANENKVQPL
jgi:hypothetical protein